MSPSELRIGNITKRTKTGEIFVVQPIDISSVANGGLALEGLPITDELLTESGYQYANENGQKFYWHTDLPYFQLRIDDDGEWLMWHSESHNETLITQEGFKYLHTLQNIHFILSGTELIFNHE